MYLAIPYNETVNGILILRKTDKVLRSDLMIECRCMCGAIIERAARNIRNGEIYPCEDCRVKYGIRSDKLKN